MAKKGKLESRLDPSRKVFEGEVTVTFYNDRLVSEGYCWHCKSRTEMQTMMTPGEARQILMDPQFKINMVELAKDDLQKHHQCGLLAEGKDRIEDVWAEMERSRMCRS